MRKLLLLPLLLGFLVTVIAHNEANGGEYGYWGAPANSKNFIVDELEKEEECADFILDGHHHYEAD